MYRFFALDEWSNQTRVSLLSIQGARGSVDVARGSLHSRHKWSAAIGQISPA
jgi:hypothetical protein